MCPIASTIFTLPPASAAASFPRALGLPAGWSPVKDIEEQEKRDGESSSSEYHGAALLAHTLSHVAASMGCRVEGFTLGPFSKLIGRALAFVPPPPPSLTHAAAAPEQSAALILVDRAMDLVSPLFYEDVLVQKMLYITASIGEEEGEGGGSDAPWSIASMPELYQSYIKVDDEEEEDSSIHTTTHSVLPFTVMHPHDAEATKHLEFLLMTRKGKDAPLFIRKWLKEALRREGLQPGIKLKPGSAVAEGELAMLASPLLQLHAPSVIGRNLSLLQLALTADQAIVTGDENHLHGSRCTAARSMIKRYNAVATEQKHCLLSCSESSSAVVSFFLDLIPLVTTNSNTLLTMEDVFSLILMAHTIRPDFVPGLGPAGDNNNYYYNEGAFSADEEAQILHCIVDHLTRDNSDSDGKAIQRGTILSPVASASVLCHPEGDVVLRQYIHSLADLLFQSSSSSSSSSSPPSHLSSEVLKLQMRDIVSDILTRLRHLAAFHHRSGSLKELQRTTRISHQDGSISSFPLLEQLTERALTPGEVIGDLTPAAASLAGLLKTGLGRFAGIYKAQPKPSAHDVVMIFVVGGASVGEMHRVMQAASAVQQQQQVSGGGGKGEAQEGKNGGGHPPKKKRFIFGCTRLLT